MASESNGDYSKLNEQSWIPSEHTIKNGDVIIGKITQNISKDINSQRTQCIGDMQCGQHTIRGVIGNSNQIRQTNKRKYTTINDYQSNQ